MLASLNLHSFPSSHVKLCHACQYGKPYQNVFPSSFLKTHKPFEVVHSDVRGPASLVSNEGFCHYVSFIDDYTRFTWILPLG